MTYKELYSFINESLTDAGIPETDSESGIILREIAGIDKTALMAHPDDVVSEDIIGHVKDVIDRRLLREPLQYILGKWNFMGLDFIVEPSTLIPRPDTETLVECAMQHLHDGMRILDLCTGTGCVLISLLHYSNDCTGVGSDISPEATDLAERNARRLLGNKIISSGYCCSEPDGVISGSDTADNSVECFSFVCGDLYTPIDGVFDIIVSNPPYIPSEVIEGLEPEVRDFEPVAALDGGTDGLDLIRRIVTGANDHLIKGGWLLCEIGFDQGVSAARIYEEAGFIEVEVIRDLAGNDRVVCGMRPIMDANR